MIPPRRENVPGSFTSGTLSYPSASSQRAVCCHGTRSPTAMVRERSASCSGVIVCCSRARSEVTTATGAPDASVASVSRRAWTAVTDGAPSSYGIVSRSGNDSTVSTPSQPASSARQRRARSSVAATSTTLRPDATSADQAYARPPALASASAIWPRPSSRSRRSRKLELVSASASRPARRGAPVGPAPARASATSATGNVPVEGVHRAAQPVAERDLGRLGRPRHGGLGGVLLVTGERREHVLREVAVDLAVGRGRRDADAQARKALADGRDDRAHAVVGAGAALLAYADDPERQVDVVVHDEQLRGREAITVEELADRAPAVVHEGLRPGDDDALPREAALRDPRVRGLPFELEPGALREP